MIFGILKKLFTHRQKTIPVLKIQGSINSNAAVKLQKNIQLLQKDFDKRIFPLQSDVLFVVIDSPGGSPVYSNIIVSKIQLIASKYNLKVYTFAQSVAASGGQMILSIGDEQYAYDDSIVGSIGVISGTFWITNFLEKHQIQPYSVTNNENLSRHKFNPEFEWNDDKNNERLKISNDIHQKFKNHILKYRENKLKILKEQQEDILFQANVFTGKQAHNLGLIDHIGDFKNVQKELFPLYKIKDYSVKSKIEKLKALFGMSMNIQTEDLELIQEYQQNFNMIKQILNK